MLTHNCQDQSSVTHLAEVLAAEHYPNTSQDIHQRIPYEAAIQADREIAPDVRIWRAVQHQRRLPDTDTNADTPASEEAIKVGRLSHNWICSPCGHGTMCEFCSAEAIGPIWRP
ncbi:hypothetical protein WJX82_011179 [Trebouxia sp. C0006]